MTNASSILASTRSGLRLQQLRDKLSTGCSNPPAISNFSVTNDGQLVAAVEVTPAAGNGLTLLVLAVTSTDGHTLYCASLTAYISGSGVAGATDAFAYTDLFTGQPGTQVTGVVAGVIDQGGGNSCGFWNEQTFTL
jgi:hypothetical protein